MTSRFLDIDAEVDSEEDDGDFGSNDEGEGEVRRKPKKATNGGLEDSSEEEDEDDDEEEERKIREGFIVDEDEDEGNREARRREKRKRRRDRDEEEGLDEEDLDLIGENNPGYEQRAPAQSKFKRLKQGHRAERGRDGPRGLEDMFSGDDLDEDLDDRRANRAPMDEFDDFIEDDFPDDERDQLLDEMEVGRPGRRFTGLDGLDTSGLDETALEDYRAAFGVGDEYEWALMLQEKVDDAQADPEKQLELKDVFEPSQLVEKMLTDEDNLIRQTDVPERFQIARKPFKFFQRDDDELQVLLQEEATWIMQLMWGRKSLRSYFRDPFHASIRKILEFFNVEDLEIPFIFQHRKDYLIHESRDEYDEPNAPVKAEKMLSQDDMWEVFDLDLKFKGLVEKREAIRTTYDSVRSLHEVHDDIMDELLPISVTIEEIQDLQDYFHFQYSAQLKDLNILESEVNGTLKRACNTRNNWEKIRASRVYSLVKDFGISADDVAMNALAGKAGSRKTAEDPAEQPEDIADSLLDPPEYSTGAKILRDAKAMFAEELAMSPRLRRYFREEYYKNGKFDCFRTEKGARQITEDSRYYEFKYIRNQEFSGLIQRPELYLRMLQAEAEGLVEVKVTLINRRSFREELYQRIKSDNQSDVADGWNALRREVLETAIDKLDHVITKGVKETLKSECETSIGRQIRAKYSEKLDQAPFKVAGFDPGATPRVLTLSNGAGVVNRDAVCWVYMEDDGRVLENGKFVDLRPGNREKFLADGKDVATFVELVRRRKPDVVGVSGFSVETRKLYKDLQQIIDENNLQTTDADDDEDDPEGDNKLQVVIVNDEVARLYHTSDRATMEFPALPPMGRYCVGLGRFLQNPILEYASLKKDIISISFDPNQDLLSEEKLVKWLDSAMVDMVNLVGVNLADAATNPYLANLLPYVSGLGPRKADNMLKMVNHNGGGVTSRAQLVGDPEKNLFPAVGAKVWQNCASFFDIPYDEEDPDSDYLDHTRVHPEDYEIARKMAADALELDEEDIKAEVDKNGASAVVRTLIKDEQQEKVNDLVLEEYAEQLELQFHQRKRATLETIRAELISPYEELRRNFAYLSTEEIFTMLTGETEDSLVEGMIIPVTIRRIFQDHIECRLDNGLEGGIGQEHYPEGVGMDRGLDVKSVYSVNQTVQARLQYLNKKALTCQVSLREDALKTPYKKKFVTTPGEWDDEQEEEDRRKVVKEKEAVSGRAQRVIKHPLFKPFNSAQAEEYLGSQGRGDVVIRPSSKGTDHLAVTWKVSDNVYQHIDVLELDKDNEFALGKTLTIGGKYKYSDLDELIVLHVKAMAKKVEEMMSDEKFHQGSKAAAEQWLTTYTDAAPTRFIYNFCINPKFAGYFYVCSKAGQSGPHGSWPVKVIPDAFELMKNPYPTMSALKNGFKLLVNSMKGPGGGPPAQGQGGRGGQVNGRR
ncbi:transcription elongation factor spt6 [Tothia fuscella]|uniref:Transcription elongation factor Spt6 n=1 Tax=Tothia fuscella TaxID=1048955 RepID=A0A9P4NLL1_9PEZI|nr:transcription elongation factor spt6 [Tothia fuscella]